jgi:serine/threonine-protein kinase
VDGLYYMALEYVDGLNLRDYLAKKGTPGMALAVSVMRQGAAALQRAGELGIIHRDIKPENILLTRKGTVKIADFGLSRCLAPEQAPMHLTQSGITMGTPLYMSPEQVEGKPLDPRSDLYSFGVTCYHMLSGQPPFRGQTAFEVALQHVQGEAESLAKLRPDLPADLCTIIHRMMAKKPEDRYQTARELFRDLTRLRETLSGNSGITVMQPTAAAEPAPTRLARTMNIDGWWRRRRRSLFVGTVAVALLGGLAAGWHYGRPDVPAEPPLPDPKAEILSYQRLREKSLLAAVRELTSQRNGNPRNRGLHECAELTQLYFEQWRLDDADYFFTNLMDPEKARVYNTFGRLGHAMVLAFQDRAEESTKQFQDLAGGTEAGIPWGLVRIINRHPGLLQLLIRALDYNAINLAAVNQKLPANLQVWRQRQPLPNKRPPQGRRPNQTT